MTKLRKKIALLPGDGIGPEVTNAAVQILQDCAAAFSHQFEFRELPFGGNAIDLCGAPLPDATLAGCRASDAILLGAIGGPKWEGLPFGTRPEAGLLGIRKGLGLYINLRPIRLRFALRDISPLRPERLGDCDFEIVRDQRPRLDHDHSPGAPRAYARECRAGHGRALTHGNSTPR